MIPVLIQSNSRDLVHDLSLHLGPIHSYHDLTIQ